MTQVLKHLPQIRCMDDPARFRFILAGRRGGKTRMTTERILEKIHKAPPGGEVFYIGPTLMQSRELIWDSMLDRLDDLRWKYKPLISKNVFEFTGRRKLYVIGAEKIRRIRGHKVFHAFLDEVAFFDAPLSEIWKAVRPALSDLAGGADIATTPNGKGTDAYDFYLDILNKQDWKYFYWRTLDNPFIDPNEIEAAKRELDARSFKQEYEASWEAFDGLAYYAFDEHLHIKPCSKLVPNAPIDIAMDFNVNPTTLIVAQSAPKMISIRKEYSQKNSSTISTIRSFCEDFAQYKGTHQIRVMGDAAGNNRSSNTGFSDYHYVKEALSAEGFNFQMCVPSANPSIVDRVSHVNSWLKNYYGESRIEIDPSCKDLIRDLSSQELDGRHPSPKNNLGHKNDALGYLVVWNQLTQGRKSQGTTHL